MTDILTDQGLIDYVSGSLPCPQHTFNATGDIVDPQGTQAQAIQAWDRKDRQALSQIRLHVSDDPLVYITDTTTSLCAWQTLADTYQPKGVIAIVLLRRQLSCLRLPTRVKATSRRVVRVIITSKVYLDFHGLEGRHCNKCVELEGKSEIYQVSIRLQDPFCNGCCNKFAKVESVPLAILDVPSAYEQINNYQTSDYTSEIWELAQGYKQIASNSRIGLPCTLNANLQKTPSGISAGLRQQVKNHALEKVVPGIAGRMDMKNTAREQGKKVKMHILLATVEGSKKHVPVPSVRIVHNVYEDLPIFEVIGNIVSEVQELYAKENPTAVKIDRSMITFYAVESVTKYYNHTQSKITNGTVSDLLLHFFEQRHITKTQFEAKQLELKLVVKATDLVLPYRSLGPFKLIHLIYHSTPTLTIRSSQLPRCPRLAHHREVLEPAREQVIEISPRCERHQKRLCKTMCHLGKCYAVPHGWSLLISNLGEKSRNVRVSAWRKPTQGPVFSRNPPTFIEYQFRPMTVEVDGTIVTIVMPPNAKFETILVASDWKAGRDIAVGPNWLDKTPAQIDHEIHQTGFIGRENSKNVVYARIGNNEYALGKAHDESLSVAEHAKMLRDEITNMYLGEHIRTQFFEFVSDVDATVPSFEFHVEGAIIGVLEPLDPGHISATLALPFQYFIATSYLPCGPSEKAIQKFTGNADCGNPPGTDALTAAIHPFYDLFCGLQGMYDRQGTMKLIDPQSHSSETNSNLRMYWDGGPKAIQHFLDHHLKSCGQNYVCNKLDMQTLEMDWDNPRPATPTGSEDFARGRSRALLLSPHQFRNKKPRPHQHHLFVLVLFALGSYSAAPLVDTFML
ncbi:hypothetical protein K438DRAFT_1767220 [Mycena galopus ATCC 62051]|nr:hypothetical protein K438DRAFT_1767220 [Mycena galopus ATCC 62051]